MPELSRFCGLIVSLIYHDTGRHNKPHVHVAYGEYRASVGLDGELLAGKLPVRQLTLVRAWLMLHEDEVHAAWDAAAAGKPFGKIEPLR